MGKITLNNMKFFAYHGCFAEEATIGTHFTVDLSMDVDTTKPQKSDDLFDTVDYQAVYLMAKDEMEKRSNLLEHVSERILKRLKNEFPLVKEATITLHKMNPPLGKSVVGSVSVTLNTNEIDV